MARHHRYSKRSRESRKAMGDGCDHEPDVEAEDWPALENEANEAMATEDCPSPLPCHQNWAAPAQSSRAIQP